MPYKDKETQKQANREIKKRRRSKSSEGVTSGNVTPVLDDPAWQNIANFINRESSTDMTNLEKLQRIAGSLGTYADQVYMGELTMAEVGKVIGTKEARF